MSSSHLFFGLYSGLLNIGFHLYTVLLTSLSSGIRCKWPNQLNLCAQRDIITYVQRPSTSFGGLDVACWPLVPKFAGSKLAEAAKKSSVRLPSEGK
jgi:hypothetical protein